MTLQLQISLPDCPNELREFKNVTQLVIGRSENCDLSLPILHDLSRQHAKLEFVGNQWFVSDLGSKFGTFVNDMRIEQPVAISDTDIVRLGGTATIRLVSKTKRHAVHPSTPVQQVDLGEAQSPSAVGAVLAPASPVATNTPAIIIDDNTGALPWHIGLGILTAIVSAALLIWYFIFTLDQPKRGYTFLGMTTGIIGTCLLGLVGFYAARKRALQELIPWKLLTWLRWHLWLSVIGFWMILIHAGFHLDGGSGTWAVLLLLAAVGTGVVGWYQYKKVPVQVVSTVGNLATGNVQKQINVLNRQIDDQLAGRDPQIASRIRHALTQVESGEATPSQISWDLVFENPAGEPFVDEVKTLVQQKNAYATQLEQQTSLHKSMRWWLWLHIPAAILFGVILAYHVFDATDARWLVDTAGPHDYADPLSCAQCHQQQYDDWIGSMHAIAMSSPVTELQNYLVVKKDRVDDGVHGVKVGQLCIECHAPTSVKGNFWEKEDLLATIDERAPSSQFGVSCVACHQISKIHATPLTDNPNATPLALQEKFQNAAGMEFTPGRVMLGPLSKNGSIAGNSAHQGKYGAHFQDASFCASCHTVQVPVNDGEKVVTLQNTYEEWQEGSPAQVSHQRDAAGNHFVDINWSKLNVNCIDCHGKPLDGLAQLATEMQDDDVPLKDRITEMIKTISGTAGEPLPSGNMAANPSDGFDRPLTDKSKYLHTFVGVDYHLEADLPYPAGHPLNEKNPEIQRQTKNLVDQLMKTAAAIEIQSAKASTDTVTVRVANLATGHHLPAGFAFAREMWIEVSIEGKVVVGGINGRALQPNEKLDKYGESESLKNFQAVLWNGDEADEDPVTGQRHGETVLQNECVKVLKGQAAVEHGFKDRQNFLEPGEIRSIAIKLPRGSLEKSDKVKVRLRFRNYPPEFLEQLADRFTKETNRYKLGGSGHCSNAWEPDEDRAKRTLEMIKSPLPTNYSPNRDTHIFQIKDDKGRPTGQGTRLQIFEMAEDSAKAK